MLCYSVEGIEAGVRGCGFVLRVGWSMCMMVCVWVWLMGVLWVVVGLGVVCSVVVLWLCGGGI